MGQSLVILGLALAAIGALVWLGVPIGRLPGDIAVKRDGFQLYVPLTTSVLLSGAFMLVSWLLRR